MLSWEGTPIQGANSIVEKITVRPAIPLQKRSHTDFTVRSQNLPFQSVVHKVTTLDAQPSSSALASLIVSVTGLLVVCPI
jgi:hypothetical protein